MDIQKTSANTVAFRGQDFKKEETQKTQQAVTKPAKDGNKKIKYALAVLGVIGAAGIGIALATRKGKGAKVVEEVQEQANKTTQHSAEIAKEAAERAQKEAQSKLNAQKAQEFYKNLHEGNLSNKSAKESAEFFKQMSRSVDDVIADACVWKGANFTPNNIIEQRIRKMDPKVLENIPDAKIRALLQTPTDLKNTKLAIKELTKLEQSLKKRL